MRNKFKFFFSNKSCSCALEKVQPQWLSVDIEQNSIKKKKDKMVDFKTAKAKPFPKASESKQKDTVAKYILRSTSNCSFVGLNKIASAQTLFGKITWGVLTLCCVTGFLYQACTFASAYRSLPTEVTLRVENSGTVEFPAVTICNNNRIRKSEYCNRNPHFCNSTDNVTLTETQIENAYVEALKSSKPNSKFQLGHSMKIIKFCTFRGARHLNTTQCLKRFQPIFDSDFGNCFTFSPKDEYGRFLYATEADFWRNANDLIFLLDKEEVEHTEEKRQSGLFLTLHSHDYFPDIHTDGIQVESGSSYTFALQQSISTLLPLPYKTNCTDFTTLPWVSKGHPSSRMCTVGCSRHFQLKDCNYVTTNLSMFYDKLPWDPSKVTKDQMKCAAEVEKRTKSYCRSLCAIPCIDIQFEVNVRKTKLRKNDLMEVYRNEDEISSEWKKLTLIKIFYKTIEKKIYQHSPMYDDFELFSFLGGYSGVWLGFSLLNLFELLEILFVSAKRAVFGCKAKSRLKKVQKKIQTSTYKTKCSSMPFLQMQITRRRQSNF